MAFLASFAATNLSTASRSAPSPTPIDQPKWNVKTTVGPDADTGGWFLNLGRTGIRAKLLPESPTEFLVTYVFPESPAAGVVRSGDRIVGRRRTTVRGAARLRRRRRLLLRLFSRFGGESLVDCRRRMPAKLIGPKTMVPDHPVSTKPRSSVGITFSIAEEGDRSDETRNDGKYGFIFS